MKLLFVIQGMQSGGAERVMSVICNSLVDQGHSVSLAITENNSPFAYQLKPEITIKDITNPKGTNVIKGRLQNIKKISRICKAEHPDAVVSFITRTNICAIAAGLLVRTPVIISERNDPMRDPKSKSTRALRSMLYPFASGCVFQTSYAMNCFSNRVRRNSKVIYNPINDAVYEAKKDGARNNTIVSVCRLNKQKNLSMLINAFNKADKIVPGYILEIYGEGEEEDNLKSQIHNLHLENKTFLRGHTSDPFSVLSRSAIFALSSDYEGMPNALIEALCMGCACVSTDSPAYGARELIENGVNGLLVPVADEEAFSKALVELMNNQEQREELGRNARQVIGRVDTKDIVNQWVEFIKTKIR